MRTILPLAALVCSGCFVGCDKPPRQQNAASFEFTNSLTGEPEDAFIHFRQTPRYQLSAAGPLMFRIDTITGRAWHFTAAGWKAVREPIPGVAESVILDVPGVGRVEFPGTMTSTAIGVAYQKLRTNGDVRPLNQAKGYTILSESPTNGTPTNKP